MSLDGENSCFREEIFKALRQIEMKVMKELRTQKTDISDNLKKFNDKADSMIKSNSQMILSVTSQKINFEKIKELENFKNKTNDILISHEIRINNSQTEIEKTKNKCDKMLTDNLTVPGFVGASCQYKNLADYIVSTINDLTRFRYEKEQKQKEYKELKTKIDSLMKNCVNLVDASIERNKDYNDIKCKDIEKSCDNKLAAFNEKNMETRIEICKCRIQFDDKVNNLKKEFDKILNIKSNILETVDEKFDNVKYDIKMINKKILKINQEIKEINENQNHMKEAITKLLKIYKKSENSKNIKIIIYLK